MDGRQADKRAGAKLTFAGTGDRGGYVNLIFAVLCFFALYRFIHEWWVSARPEGGF